MNNQPIPNADLEKIYKKAYVMQISIAYSAVYLRELEREDEGKLLTLPAKTLEKCVKDLDGVRDIVNDTLRSIKALDLTYSNVTDSMMAYTKMMGRDARLNILEHLFRKANIKGA